MKRHLIGPIAVVILIGIGLVACDSAMGTPANQDAKPEATNAASETKIEATQVPTVASAKTRVPVAEYPTLVPPEAENLLMLPDAMDINHDKIYDADWRRTRYTT